MENSSPDGIFHFEVEGRRVLGFDTGLSPEAFAKARLGSLMTSQGLIVDSTIQVWVPEGTAEHQGHMVFYGSDFSGEVLENLLAPSDETALRALQQYLRALAIIASHDEGLLQNISLFPAGVLISNDGAVLFTPQVLAKRVFEYQSPPQYIQKVVQWLHPDKKGTEAALFTAAVLTYRLFTGKAPFSVSVDTDQEKIRELLALNIRDGFCRSASLVTPNLLPDLARTLDGILCPDKNSSPVGMGDLQQILGEPGSKKLSDFYLEQEVQRSLVDARLKDFERKQRRILVQRFFHTHKHALLASVGTVIALFLIVWSILAGQKQRPSTIGMTPIAVAETYYKAFNTLDHQWMDACVTRGTGKGDIEAVINMFVISRTREAYERKATIIDPETWKTQGSPATELTIFGIANLKLQPVSSIPAEPAPGDNCKLEATYEFYYPDQVQTTQPGAQDPASQSTEPMTRIAAYETHKDLLTLEWSEDRWRIISIERSVLPIPQSDTP